MRVLVHTLLIALIAFTGAVESFAQVTFLDVAEGYDLANATYGRGTAMVDLNGDGLLDIITANDSNPNDFFRQLPDHTFEKVNDAWGIAFDDRSTWAVLAADFDNDGDTDVYFVSGINGQPNQLLRNDLNLSGVFTDVSGQAGDAALLNRNFGGTTLDYNRDGHLDIFLTNPNSGPCFLLRNEGGLIFSDVSVDAGIVDVGTFRHCSAGDFNNDGWWDIAVGDFGNFGTSNVLYRNNQDGTFTDVAASAGVESPLRNFGMVLEDFDNDGWMDIFLPKYHYLPEDVTTSELYRNNGDGTFSNVTAGAMMTTQTDMGHNTGDVDGDGYPDIFIGTGHPGFESDDMLLLVTPDGAGGFATADVSDSSGITAQGPTRCHGIAMGDYDLDGDIDIYTNNGGPPQPQYLEENYLWNNQGNGHGWTALHLTGVISNRSAVGARCVATTTAGRDIHRAVRAGNGFGNTSSLLVHFGIGTHVAVESIEITWPSGIVQVITDPPMSQVLEVTEQRPSDLNDDASVNAADLALLLGMWGPCDTCIADLNGDAIVNAADLALLLGNWGQV